jgi:outer membrane protein OmpA-like peptidoglycan-associated protein
MPRAPRFVAALLVAAAGSTAACGSRRVASTPVRPGESLIVLLPDEGGSVGRATIATKSGSVELRGRRDGTRVVAQQAPAQVTRLSEGQIREIFGEALEALPPPPRRFTLNFQFESNELTDGSKQLLPGILEVVRERAVPDVAVVGHTDTMGSPTANYALGLKRAIMVRDLLVEAGLNASYIEVLSHPR